MKNLVWMALAAFVLCVGCVTQAEFETRMNAWIGQSTATLLESWGEPISTAEIANGNTVYVYEFGKLGAASIDPIRAAARTENLCRVGMEIEANMIKSYEYFGGYRNCAGHVPGR